MRASKSTFVEANPAHRILAALGMAHVCGIWEKVPNRKNQTPQKDDKARQKKRDAASAKVSIVLRNYFAGKARERMKLARKKREKNLTKRVQQSTKLLAA